MTGLAAWGRGRADVIGPHGTSSRGSNWPTETRAMLTRADEVCLRQGGARAKHACGRARQGIPHAEPSCGIKPCSGPPRLAYLGLMRCGLCVGTRRKGVGPRSWPSHCWGFQTDEMGPAHGPT